MKIDFCPQNNHALIENLTVLRSAFFYELGAALIAYHDVMRGWYDGLHKIDIPVIFDVGLILG